MWPHVHRLLIVALHDDLGARLPPKYYVAVDERVYLTTYDDPYFVYPDLAVGHVATGQASEAAAIYRAGNQTPAPDGAQTVLVPVPREMR
ncbi:MAG: DUF4058 family protein, partial [Bacillota bacterium]